MNRKLIHPSLAVAVAAFLATGVAVAQTNTPSANQPMTSPSGTQADKSTMAPAGTAATPGTSGSSASQAGMPSKTDSASSAFSKLSSKHAGYVTSEDVSKLQGFDFKSADKNNDGRLDESEFNTAWTTYSSGSK